MSRAMAEFTTRILAVDPAAPDRQVVAEAAALIRAGQLVAFPTETVYGLGADALNPSALRRIYTVKGRPADNPLILHIADRGQLCWVAATVPELASALMAAFWPGALTLVLPKAVQVPDLATGGLDTVAVRMPAHPVALALIEAAHTPLAGPSANRSGRPSPTTAQHVFDDLQGRIPLILDAGPTAIGVESTVLDLTSTPPAILRPGGVSREAIEALIGPLQKAAQPALQRRSPGTRYRHYSPQAAVRLIDTDRPEELRGAIADALQRGQRVGCLLHRLHYRDAPPDVIVCRIPGCLSDYARALFAALRSLDALGVDIILVETVPEEDIGTAVMDRLRRAASAPNSEPAPPG
jgi:L-threonylcarbamoyladenylate synthase